MPFATLTELCGSYRISIRTVGNEEMPRCEICNGCWFYRSEITPASQEFELLKKYCHGEYLDCDRYQFAPSLGIRYLPKWLESSDCRMMEGDGHSPME